MGFFGSLKSLIRTRFGALIEDNPTLDLSKRVEYYGAEPDPTWRTRRWARLTIRLSGADIFTSNGVSSLHGHTGLVAMEFYVPAGLGSKALDELCDAGANCFRAWHARQPSADVHLLRFGSPTISDIGVDGAWLRAVVSTSFEAFGNFLVQQ